ncbi:extensin-like [Vombatus ursinus]|uniref:extensin-like n=1 Tax=Vombatus ursinus TaxID=29139 RepID=UPI000FFCE202|nr:extensin-like [Vombatus ursinus]
MTQPRPDPGVPAPQGHWMKDQPQGRKLRPGKGKGLPSRSLGRTLASQATFEPTTPEAVPRTAPPCLSLSGAALVQPDPKPLQRGDRSLPRRPAPRPHRSQEPLGDQPSLHTPSSSGPVPKAARRPFPERDCLWAPQPLPAALSVSPELSRASAALNKCVFVCSFIPKEGDVTMF